MPRIAAGTRVASVGFRTVATTSLKSVLRGLADRGIQNSNPTLLPNYFPPDAYLPGITILVLPVFGSQLQPAVAVTGAVTGATSITVPPQTTSLLKPGDTIVLYNPPTGVDVTKPGSGNAQSGERVIVASGYAGTPTIPLTSAVIGVSYSLAGFNSPIIAAVNGNDSGSVVNGTATNIIDQTLAKITGTQTSGGPQTGGVGDNPSYANLRAAGVNLKLRLYAASRGPFWWMYLEDSNPGVPAGAGIASGPWRYSDLSDTDPNIYPLNNPRFWTQAYRIAWSNYVKQLVKLYDGNASINEVCIDRMQMSTYPETFLRDANDNNNANTLATTTVINDTTLNLIGVPASTLRRLLPGAPVYLSHGTTPFTFDEVVYTKNDGTYVVGSGWPSAAAIPIQNKVLVGGSTVGSWGDPIAALNAGFTAPDAAKQPDNVTYWTLGAGKTSGANALIPGPCGFGSAQATLPVTALQAGFPATTPNGQPVWLMVNYGGGTVEFFAFDAANFPAGVTAGATSIPLAPGQVCKFAHGNNQPVVPILAGSDRYGHLEQILDMASLWKQTPISLALNPYQAMEVLNQTGAVGVAPSSRTDEAFTEFMLTYFRSALGNQAMIKNFSIRDLPQSVSGYPSMYAAIAARGAPLAFQSAQFPNLFNAGSGALGPNNPTPPSGTPTTVQSLHATLRWAKFLQRANYVEIPTNYYYTDQTGTGDWRQVNDPALRSVADGTTNGTTSISSPTIAFTDADIGRLITGTDLSADTYIVSRSSGTTAVISKTATGSHTGTAAFTLAAGTFLTSADAATYDAMFKLNSTGFAPRVVAGARVPVP